MTFHHCVAQIVILSVLCGCTASADDAPSGLSDLDVSVRQEAWRSIANNDPETNADRILALLPKGFRDPDSEVRRQALAAATRIGITFRQKKRFILSEHSELSRLLLEMLTDEDPKVRADVLLAIGYAIEPTKQLEETLLARFPHESDPNCRDKLIGVLLITSGNPSAPLRQRETTQAVTELFVSALDDSSETVRGAAARSIGSMKTPPPQALPKLEKGLDASHPYAAQFCISAINRYGSAAKTYLPSLEKLRSHVNELKGTEGDVLRSNLDNAIRHIREAIQTDDKTSPGK